MDLRVAVHAAAALPHIDDVLAVRHVGDLWCHLACSRKSENTSLSAHGTNRTRNVGCMALLAQHGRACLEHAGDVASM